LHQPHIAHTLRGPLNWHAFKTILLLLMSLQVRDQMELLRVQPIDQSIPAEDIMGRSYCRYQGPRT